ncbi:hypothetical protein J2743_002084 [Methanobacterium petrolearium]|nr:hypothetical protein [Methanobacterium petrolearium]
MKRGSRQKKGINIIKQKLIKENLKLGANHILEWEINRFKVKIEKSDFQKN